MKLAIVTPSRNQADFLPECLASVRREAGSLPAGWDVHHHIQDGASTDDSVNILASQDFATWESTPDNGQAHAVNLGWERVSGDIMAFLCADDFYEPGALQRVTGIFDSQAEVDVVYGDYYFLEGDSGWKRRKSAGNWSVQRLHRGNFLSQPAVFWRRRVYERFGGLDVSLQFCLDHEYWLRIAPQTSWYYLPVPLATMRLHSDAKTASQLTAMWWESARMQRKYGIRLRPAWQALQMQLWGCHYYHIKRRIFRWLGKYRGGCGKTSE
jgi:glycosyltransferase involved in cell wall biosynthesis